MKKQKTRSQIFYAVFIGLIIIIIFLKIISIKLFKDYNIQTQVQNVIEEKEDPNCPKEEGKLCDTRQKSITPYKDICEKKKK